MPRGIIMLFMLIKQLYLKKHNANTIQIILKPNSNLLCNLDSSNPNMYPNKQYINTIYK